MTSFFKVLSFLSLFYSLSLSAENINLNSLNERISKLEDISFGGAIRSNYSYQDWSNTSKEKGGDFKFELFAINVNKTKGELQFYSQYRIYHGKDFVHHAYLQYQLEADQTLKIGITKVPFGLLPYDSDNYWGAITYYLGFSDDYDAGIAWNKKTDNLSLDLAFFKGSENNDTNSFSFDPQGVESEQNTMNLRAAYNDGAFEAGASLRLGRTVNTSNLDNSENYAAALHVKHSIGKWDFSAESVVYEYALKSKAKVITKGGFATSYDVPANAIIHVVNIGRNFNVNFGPIKHIKLYHNRSMLDKKGLSGGKNSYLNTSGALLSAGKLYTYFDVISGKNADWLGTDGGFGNDLADQHHTLINVNMGYYF